MNAILANGPTHNPPFSSQAGISPLPIPNGIHHNGLNGDIEMSDREELERLLPFVNHDQIPLGILISRIMQHVYEKLVEMAETMPRDSDLDKDAIRKRKILDFTIEMRRQVIKLYAVVKWARDAEDLQKSMNIVGVLGGHNAQFNESSTALSMAQGQLTPARMRNHDLLTALDVLTSGSYRRLPSCFEKLFIPPKPLSNQEIAKSLIDFEDALRFRLRTRDVIPVEMKQYRIANGRVYFFAPGLFETSLLISGAGSKDVWGFIHVEFLINIPRGEGKGLEDFPRIPTGQHKDLISAAAHEQLLPREQPPVQTAAGTLETVVDAPLVRVFNLLQMLSLTYQLEILLYQANRLRYLGWQEYLSVACSPDRKTIVAHYWTRKQTGQPPRPPNQPNAPPRLPLFGGTLTITLTDSTKTKANSFRSPVERVRAELEEKSKTAHISNGKRLSDQVESLQLKVKWEAARYALAVNLPKDAMEAELTVDPSALDFEVLLTTAIRKHTDAVLRVFRSQLLMHTGPRKDLFADDEVVLVEDGGNPALQITLCPDQVVIVTIDTRTGRIDLRDAGDLAAAGRGPRFWNLAQKINEQPYHLINLLVSLRSSTIIENVDAKAQYLGLQTYKNLSLLPAEQAKFGPNLNTFLFIQLTNYPSNYLVIVIDDAFKFALISISAVVEGHITSHIINDFGWIDVAKMKGGGVGIAQHALEAAIDPSTLQKRRPGDDFRINDKGSRFDLGIRELREIYAYCCARVSHTKIEEQLKIRSIAYTHVLPEAPTTDSWRHIRSSLARSVPDLCVQSGDILAGAAAAEAAMPNIRISPINWWNDRKCQVVTSVKLKHVQPPVGKHAGTARVIRPSPGIMYDTTTSVVCFLSDNVDTCVGEFLDEWTKVSKIVVVAREVATLAKAKKWDDVRLLSFDLQTVEFTYSSDYAVCIRCDGGSYDLAFSQHGNTPDTAKNPHEDMAPLLRGLLKNERLASSVHELITLLRDSLPVVLELEEIRLAAAAADRPVDVFAKAAGWFRVMYGDLRHALDFRLMKEKKVLVIDGSFSLFGGSAGAGSGSEKDKDKGGSAGIGMLQRIPGFEGAVEKVVREVGRGAVGHDFGLLCDAAVLKVAAKALHREVSSTLTGGGGT